MGALLRPGLWGCAAIATVLAVAVAAQTERGHHRLAGAYGALTGLAPSAAPGPDLRTTRERDAEPETRRLAESLRTLSDDRDQLLARMTALERNYDDVTGSIGRLGSAPKSLTEALPQAFPLTGLSRDAAQPTIPLATIPVAPAERPGGASQPADTPDGLPVKTEFGVDLGGGPSLAALRTAWNQVRRNHASLLDGLRPVAGIRDGKAGQAELRLVVGPFTNAGAAAKLCAALAAGGLSCQPTMFDGQRLALR